MWIPGGVAYLIAAGAVLVRWLEFDDTRHPARKRRAVRRSEQVQKTADAPEAAAAAGNRLSAAIRSRAASLILLLCVSGVLLTGLSGCGSSAAASIAATVGDPQHGAALIRSAGCGSCHIVPGINDANGLVGPPLTQMGLRVYIAGVLRNTPSNMVQWLMAPQSIVPGNAMPDMGLTENDARDITAYLYTLQ